MHDRNFRKLVHLQDAHLMFRERSLEPHLQPVLSRPDRLFNGRADADDGEFGCKYLLKYRNVLFSECVHPLKFQLTEPFFGSNCGVIG